LQRAKKDSCISRAVSTIPLLPFDNSSRSIFLPPTSKEPLMSDTLHLVCPHCHAVNRVPAARRAGGPNCGQCHQPLFTGQPVELSGANFAKNVGRSDLPVLVDFWAPWCGPCKMMAPQFVEAAALLEPEVRLAKLNTEAEQAIGAQYGIRSIPTLVLFKGGRELARQSGAMGAQDIVRWTRAQLGA
jgi:thioredoxin 2